MRWNEKRTRRSFFIDLQITAAICKSKSGAGNETRTRDPDLGKVVLYQLSYSRLIFVFQAASALTTLPQPEILSSGWCFQIFGAGNETRTRDPDLGKVVLYQLSYSRIFRPYFYGAVMRISASSREAHYTRIGFTCNPLRAIFFVFSLSAHFIIKYAFKLSE